jgi:hypothetical protein
MNLTDNFKHRDFNLENEGCTFCGASVFTGTWLSRSGYINCCSRCAKSVLPSFYADCIRAELTEGIAGGEKAIEEFRGSFWRAFAHRVSQKVKAVGLEAEK